MYQHYLTDKRLCYEDEGVKLNMLTGKRIKDIKAWNLKVSLCPPFLLYGLKLREAVIYVLAEFVR